MGKKITYYAYSRFSVSDATTLRTCLVKNQATQYPSYRRNICHGNRALGAFLVVFAQPSLTVEPTEGPLHDPPHRLHLKSLSFATADVNIDVPIKPDMIEESAPVALIRAYRPHTWQIGQSKIRKHAPLDGIGPIRPVNMHGPHVAFRVYGDLAAPAFDLLAAMEPALIPFVVGFDRLRIDQQVAWCRLTPFFFRSSSLSSQQISCHTPRSFSLRKWS